MLEVKDINVEVKGIRILEKISLTLRQGEIVAVMGPNGSGKSTLAYAIMGREGYNVVSGKIVMDGEDITELPPEERSLKGLFLVHQAPPEIPGVKLSTLLLAATNKRIGYENNLLKVKNPRILRKITEYSSMLGLKKEILYRDLNKDLSGGEKKRSELLQLLILQPRYAILDEPDSGMDVDGLKIIAEIINNLRKKGTGILLITHYTRLFSHIAPDRIVLLINGKVFASKGPELARIIDEKGYKKIVEEGIRAWR